MDKWSKNIKEYKENAPEGLWEAIEKDLPKEEKRRFLEGYWLLLLLLLGSIGAYYFVSENNGEQNTMTQTTQVEATKSKENYKAIEGNNGNEGSKTNKESSSFQNEKVDLATLQNDNSNDINELKSKTKKRKASTRTPNKVSDKTLDVINLNEKNSSYIDSNSDKAINENTLVNADNSLNNQNNNSQLPNLIEDENELTNSEIEETSNPKSTNSPKSIKSKKPKITIKNFGIQGFGALTMSGNNMFGVRELINAETKMQNSYQLGVSGYFKLKDDKMRLYVGVEKSSYRFQSGNVYLDSLNNNSVISNINYGNLQLYVNNQPTMLKKDLETRLEYFSFTIGLDYKLFSIDKFSTRAFASYSLSSLQKSDIFIMDGNRKLGEINSLKDEVMKTNLGLMADYSFTKHWQLFLAPNWEHYNKNFESSSNWSFSNFNFRFGLNYNF